MAVVGSAQVLIRPTFSGMQRDIERELGGAGEVAGQRSGSRFGDSLAKWGKRGAILAGGAIAAGLGASLATGFSRLTAIEDAEAMLRGLGHSVEDVEAIMQNAMDSTEGTAIRMDKMATTAAQMVAAGIEPGKELEEVLRLVGDAATIAGGDMDGMSQIFGKVAAANRLSMGEVNQMQERGIPILQMVADEMGVTQEAARDMVSAGEVDFELFSQSMETNLGGAAQEAGGTMRGSLENLGAYVARFGASLLEGVFPSLKDGINGLSEWFQGLEPVAERIGEVVGEWMSNAAEAVGKFLQEFRDGEGVGGQFRDVVDRVGDALKSAFDYVTGTVVPALKDMATWLKDNEAWLVPIAAGIAAIAAAWKVYQVTMAIVRGVTTAFIAVQTALNAVLAMNPIGLVVLALVGLAAAFAVAWNRSETFRNIVTAAWEGIKSAASAVWDWMKKAFQWIKDGIASVGQWFTDRGKDIEGVWQSIQTAIGKAWIWIQVNVFAPIKRGINLVKMGFEAAGDGIGIAWDAVKNGLKAGWDWIDRNVFQSFRRGLDTLVDWVRSGRDTITDLWEGVKTAFATPINWVIRNAWNNGLLRAINAVARVIPGVSEISPLAEIRTRAKGGYTPPGWTLVGEEGPELVNFTAPGRVYTAADTQAMLANPGMNPAQQFSAGNPPHGGVGGWFSDRWDDVRSAGRWVADGVRDVAGNVVSWARGSLAKAAEIVLNPIRSLIQSSLGSGEGFLGDLLSGTGTMAIDKLLEWLRDEDEGSAPDAGGRSLRGAQPHVNNAAHALADAVGGIRTMQAFNQSMAGGHPAGKAVDFIDSVSKLNRLADVISGGGHFDNFNYMAWQGRLWSPGRGWRPQGRGYGNDPQHRWHLHAEWFDQGGMLKPGMGTYANATGQPEPVLTAGQWRDISTLAARGSGMSFPEHVTLVDESGAMLGRMRVVAQDESQRALVGVARRAR